MCVMLFDDAVSVSCVYVCTYVCMYVCMYVCLPAVAVSFSRSILDEAPQPTPIFQDLIISEALNRVSRTAINVYSCYKCLHT